MADERIESIFCVRERVCAYGTKSNVCVVCGCHSLPGPSGHFFLAPDPASSVSMASSSSVWLNTQSAARSTLLPWE